MMVFQRPPWMTKHPGRFASGVLAVLECRCGVFGSGGLGARVPLVVAVSHALA